MDFVKNDYDLPPAAHSIDLRRAAFTNIAHVGLGR
jgi:hypothetical protein